MEGQVELQNGQSAQTALDIASAAAREIVVEWVPGFNDYD